MLLFWVLKVHNRASGISRLCLFPPFFFFLKVNGFILQTLI